MTYASTEAQKFGAIARPGCLLAQDFIPTYRNIGIQRNLAAHPFIKVEKQEET